MINCKNCNYSAEISSNYCPNCGQPFLLKRINGHYIIHEIEHVLHFEKGILYTVKELFIRPGKNIRQFLSENRSRLVKPIIFIIITSLIYTLVNHLFHIEDGLVKYSEQKQTATATAIIFKWVQDHYGYANIIMAIFIALWLKLFFRKYGYNFFEILILLCFVMGIGMLIYSIFAIIQGLTHIHVMTIAGLAGFIYTTFAIGQFYEKDKIINYVKAFSAYVLGMITFTLIAIIIGTTIDLLIKH